MNFTKNTKYRMTYTLKTVLKTKFSNSSMKVHWRLSLKRSDITSIFSVLHFPMKQNCFVMYCLLTTDINKMSDVTTKFIDHKGLTTLSFHCIHILCINGIIYKCASRYR